MKLVERSLFCSDEKAVTAIGVLRRAVAWFADRGVSVERVLPDDGSAYRFHAWAQACAELTFTHKRTRPYRPQTNGFHRTLADGWAYARLYPQKPDATPYPAGSSSTIITEPPQPSAAPITRLNNLPGHHSWSKSGRGRGVPKVGHGVSGSVA